MRHFSQDLRYAWRMLARTPGFTAVGVASLALGIGANTAIFSVVYSALLKPLPFRDPARLMAVWDTYQPFFPKLGLSPPEYEAVRHAGEVFEATAWYRYVATDLNLEIPGESAVELHGTVISPEVLPLLGVAPALGRAFDPRGPLQSVLLSDALWRSRFAADRSVLGRGIRLGGAVYTIAGVMPPDFKFPEASDFYLPPGPEMGDEMTNPARHAFGVLARLSPGVSQEQVRVRIAGVLQQLAAKRPQTGRGFGTKIAALQDDLTAGQRPSLLMLLGAGGLVLLIACGNVANLLLSRGAARTREIAIRSALGAGSLRLLRQLLTESLLLAALGGAAGLGLAALSLGVLSPVKAPLDAPVLAFATLVSLITGAAFGLAPVIQARAIEPIAAIKGGAAPAAHSMRVRGALVACEVAFTLVVVTGAGILAKSFVTLMRVDPGVDGRGVLALRLAAPAAVEPAAMFTRIHDRLKQLPGVQAVASTNALPLVAQRAAAMRFNVPGSPLIHPDNFPVAQQRWVTAEYFAALGIPLHSGRWLTAQDVAQPVAVVNQTLAQRFWPGQDAVGRRFIPGPPGSAPNFVTIVGVVGDVKQFGLDSEATMDIYFPDAGARYLVVRTAGETGALAAAVERVLGALEPGLAVTDVRTMSAIVEESARSRRWTAGLLAVFAGLALSLALVGIYGVVSWAVAQRTREIGIRMALGAGGAQVLRMVLGQGARLAALGLGMGYAACLALRPVMAGLVFGVSTLDPAVYAGAAALLFAAAMLACYLPARRASRVAPLIALRHD